jgi:hypothetical protein
MDSHVADAPQNDEKTGETSAIDTLKDLIDNAIEKLPSETYKSEIDIARETLE